MSNAVNINPELLVWARETAGLTLAEAAKKLGFKNSIDESPEDKLASIERGQAKISESKLEIAAKIYDRPLTAFYMSVPPKSAPKVADFRTAQSAISLLSRQKALLDSLIRRATVSQEMLLEILDEDEAARLPFVGSASRRDGFHHVANSIRRTLGVTVEDQRARKNPEALFNLLRSAAENAGIYVLLYGNLGSYHTRVGVDVFRGFALTNTQAPFVVINSNDAVTARSFTLVDELAHIWIGASGVSGSLRLRELDPIESCCNKVAGQFLLPREYIIDSGGDLVADAREILSLSEALAHEWNISRGVAIYGLLRANQITPEGANAAFQMLAKRVEKPKDTSSGGPDYNTLKRHGLGRPILNQVTRALNNETITHTKAAIILGVKPTSITKLLQPKKNGRHDALSA